MKFEGLGNGLSDSLLAAANAIVLESGDYKKFFQAALKKFGVTSPAELKGDKEKEFYDYIDKNWDGKDEKKEAKIEEVLPTPIDGVAESETFNEKAGKYAKYSDLLMQKARLVAQGPAATKEVGDINKKIASEIKKLGIKEDKGFERILMSVFEGQIEEKAKPSKKFIKLGDEKKNLKSQVTEASRDYYKQADSLISKHGEETAFVYKSPKLNKIVKELQNLIKKEVKAGFKGSKKDGETVIKQLQKLEVMGYDENIVMTNKQHSNFKFDGDTAFREEMAEIIMQDAILSYAIFGE
tara:strand:- start:707 stop:1594 length:888 start_codon:yes stop_codon:yes gene_type:complete